MEISDILILIEIVVTILVGYYITHWVSVRDTRTRMVKDFYISELKKIKYEVDSFFSSLYSVKLNGREISDWYGHQQQALTSFDDGLRIALPIKKMKLEDIVNLIHEKITGSDYFNDHFGDEKYQMNGIEKAKVIELQDKLNKAFNEYLVQINNSRQFYSWELIIQNFKYDLDYYRSVNKSYPLLRTIGIRLLKLIPYIAFLFLMIYAGIKVYTCYNEKQLENTQERNREILLHEAVKGEIVKQNATFEDLVKYLKTMSENETDIVVKISNKCCNQNNANEN